jgi:signal transduction histidine kinase
MPRLRFRTWYVLAILGTVILAAQLTRGLGALEMQARPDLAAVRAAANPMIRGSAHWDDAAWQRSMNTRLGRLHLDAVITSGTGRVVYRHDTGLVSRSPSAAYTIVTSRGLPIGTVSIYGGSASASGDTSNFILATEVLLVIVIVLLLFGGWFVGGAVRRPLAVMSKAAHRIADGYLDVQIPASKVREIAEVGTAFAEMADRLRAARERQAALEQERAFLITAIAHDLRTPLFALRSRLEGLERGLATTPEKASTYIRVAREKADALERLIADMFAYTRLEYLEQSLQEEDVEIGLLLGEAVEGIRPHAEAKGVTVTIDGAEQPIVVRGDAHLLARAVGNLLDNALRYTPDGGHVGLRWRGKGDRLVFEVSDSGPGIALDDLPLLFEPLYRVDTSRNTQTGGVGLGLTIAQRIVRAHGGELTAANRPTGGAVFTGTLPMAGGISQPAAALTHMRREHG